MTKVEEVAQAICEASGGYWREPPFNSLHTDALNNHWRHAARAAIAAMREPTPAVLSALIDAVNDWQNEKGDDADILRKTIDAALSEEGE